MPVLRPRRVPASAPGRRTHALTTSTPARGRLALALVAAVVAAGCGTGLTPANPTPAQRGSSTPTVFASATSSAPSAVGSSASGRGGVPAGAPGSPTPATATTATLRTYGLVNGPDDFELPAGLVVIESIDQPNVVTLVLPPDVGPGTASWLARNLPRQGYRVEAASTDSVVFSGPTWSGSFTSDEQLAGFTLRRNA